MKGALPEVSIVLPVYNDARYIRQSIDSCLNQTFQDIELIIVDDGSTDETPGIIRSYKDPRIKGLNHKTNQGLPYALNTGFEKAAGRYLTWTSSDNLYAKNAIEKMLLFLADQKCSFVYCDYYCFNDDDLSNATVFCLPDSNLLYPGNLIGACFLFSREVMETTGGYDPDTVLAEDYDYWARVSKNFSMRHLAEPLYLYRMHKNSLTSLKVYEVATVACLVQVKNDLACVRKIAGQFTDLVARRINRCLGFDRPLRGNGIRSGAVKRLVKFFLSNSTRKIFEDYKAGRISFGVAKKELSKIGRISFNKARQQAAG